MLYCLLLLRFWFVSLSQPVWTLPLKLACTPLLKYLLTNWHFYWCSQLSLPHNILILTLIFGIRWKLNAIWHKTWQWYRFKGLLSCLEQIVELVHLKLGSEALLLTLLILFSITFPHDFEFSGKSMKFRAIKKVNCACNK